MSTLFDIELKLPALEIRQGPRRVLYSFAVDGKLLSEFATISRIHRDGDEALRGYQRPEVLSHIAEIRNYVESEAPMIPNAIVVAFDDRVRFEPAVDQPVGPEYSRFGTLIIPIDSSLPDEDKPGWIVDGQQRTAAIREAQVERFPVCVTAFIAKDDQEQKEQFILVNSTKPLPKGLIYELLPSTESRLPSLLQRRRFPAHLSERMNYDLDSPSRALIQTPTNPDGLIKDNSVLKMLENSLNEGALHYFRDPRTGRGDVESMLRVLKAYWRAVKDVFEDAWGLLPRRSRLMHGAGVVSLGFVMDAIAEPYLEEEQVPTVSDFHLGLEPLVSVCSWTSGVWLFVDKRSQEGGTITRRWNEIQNTSTDIALLTDHLLSAYSRLAYESATPAVRVVR
jgi:DGQHR domain-containing protein